MMNEWQAGLGNISRCAKRYFLALLFVVLCAQVLFSLNLEKWAEKHEFDKILVTSEAALMDVVKGVLEFLRSDLVIGFVAGGLVASFGGPLWRLLTGKRRKVRLGESTAEPTEERGQAIPIKPPSRVEPLFAPPVQRAKEHYLSWWHIPVSVSGLVNSPPAEIRNSTAELIGVSANLPTHPIKLRWQADNESRGVFEITLVAGINRLIPVVARCETYPGAHLGLKPMADGIGRITGMAFLVANDPDKYLLTDPVYRFKIRVRAGGLPWKK